MINQSTAIEINGGGRNKIKDSNLTVKGVGKGIVLNDTSDNEIANVSIVLESEIKYFLELKSALTLIDDNSINPTSQKTFKSETLSQVQQIIDLPNRESFKKNTSELINLLSSWITIKTALTPVMLPHITALLKLAGG